MQLTLSLWLVLLLLSGAVFAQEESAVDASALNVTEPADALRFLLLGDWGKYGTTAAAANRRTPRLRAKAAYQTQVAAAMASYASAAEPPCSFIVSLGDNFYDNGVQSATDTRWDYLWRNVYHGAYPSLAVPWYPVFGNHDYGFGASGVQAQIDRTDAHVRDDDLWVFPATNYSRAFRSGNVSVQIVFVDTTTLAPSENKCCNQNGGVSASEQSRRIADQLINLKAMLEEAAQEKPTWLLVAGHYPIYSSGEHSDTSELLTYLLPLLRAHGVHAYLSGHDHVSEHLSKDGIEYFIAGAGSMADSMGASSAAQLNWYGAGYSAFGTVLATSSSLTVSFINTNNKEVYSYALTNPNEADPTESPSELGAENMGDSPDSMESAATQENGSAMFDYFLFFVLGAFLVVGAYSITRVKWTKLVSGSAPGGSSDVAPDAGNTGNHARYAVVDTQTPLRGEANSTQIYISRSFASDAPLISRSSGKVGHTKFNSIS